MCTNRLTTDLGISETPAAGELQTLSDVQHDEDDSRSYIFEDSDDDDDDEDDHPHEFHLRLPSGLQHAQEESEGGDSRPHSWTTLPEGDTVPSELDKEEGRNVKQKVNHPSSPRSDRASALLDSHDPAPAQAKLDISKEQVPGPAKLQVVVKDAAYSTYRAVLYYVSFATPLLAARSIDACN